MQPTVGEIYEGKVTGITKFGAFVALADGKSGLVHISEIANTYVNDVHDHLSEGQTVKVVVIGLGDNGKINLSIKKTEERPQRQERPFRPQHSNMQRRQQSGGNNSMNSVSTPTADQCFEDKLKQFMQESDSKISGNRLYADKKNGSRRRRG